MLLEFKSLENACEMHWTTRMHSSRMRTGRSLTVCRSLLPGGGGCLVSGVGCLVQGGLLWGGCLLPGAVCSWGVSGHGVSGPGGVSAPGGVLSQGGSGPGGGGCLLLGGGWVVSQHALRQTPPCEQNDRQVQKYYLGHNFVAAGKNVQKFRDIKDFPNRVLGTRLFLMLFLICFLSYTRKSL